MFNDMLTGGRPHPLILSQMELQVTGVDDMDLYGRSDQKCDVSRPGFPEADDRGGKRRAAALIPSPPGPMVLREAAAEIDPNDPSTWGKVSRNAPCPCGSGKKY